MENLIQKVFIVDDNKFHLSSVEQIIKNIGYTDISCFSNGVDCLNEIHQNPEIVFLDHEMDEYSGYQVLNKIKRYNPNIIVIMVSGQEDIEVVVNALKYGALDYIQKNQDIETNIEQVLLRVENLLIEVQTHEKKSSFEKLKKFFFHRSSRVVVLLLLLLSGLFFSSCKTLNLFSDHVKKQNELDSVFLTIDHEYTIKQNDKVSISVWKQDELSVGSIYGIYNSNEVYGKWMLVDAAGNIEGPKVGTVHVEGKTVIELKSELRTYFSKWVNDPIVDVKILNKEIAVLGEVKNPSKITIEGESKKLLNVIAQCQGFDDYAELRKVKILRETPDSLYVANINLTDEDNIAANNLQLIPGDVVIVPSKKHKEFDKRIANIIPISSSITAAVVLLGLFIQ